MRIYKYLRLLGDVVEKESLLEDVTITRISPRSYRNGEISGWYSGLAVGFVTGMLVTIAVIINQCC